MSRSVAIQVAALVTCGSIGCGGLDAASGGTLGEEGRVEFSYRRDCFFGCPLDQPLLEGTRQTIDVSGPGDAEGVVVQASDPALLELHLERSCYCERADGSDGRIDIARDASCQGASRKRCDNDILVQANDSGDAFVELLDADGALIDRGQVRVRRAQDAAFFATFPDRLGRHEGVAFSIAQDETLALEVELYDDEGRLLLAPQGVVWLSDAPQVATLSAWLQGQGARLETGLQVQLEGLAQGTAKVLVQVPGLEADVEVSVE